MNKPRRKHKYPTDTEVGIRTITQIRALPSGQLTDEEFVKEFFDRFEAKALLLTYIDEKNVLHRFGRLKHGAMASSFYRGLIQEFERVWHFTVQKYKDQ